MNQLNFQFSRGQDALLQISLASPTSVSGWAGEFFLTRNKGGDRIFTKCFASGFVSNQSGITLLDGSIGRFNISLNAVDSSGLDFGNYNGEFWRRDSGFETKLSEGFITVK